MKFKIQISNKLQKKVRLLTFNFLFLTFAATGLFSFSQAVHAANSAKIYMSSVKTDYSIGESIYIKVRVNPGVESINVVRGIINFNTAPATFVSKTLDGAWLYPSPGSFADGAAGVVNQGGFLLADTVTTDSQFMTLEFKAEQVGTLTLNVATTSLLVDGDMNNQLNYSILTSYSVNIGTAPAPTPIPAPSPTPTPTGPVNHAPVINDLGEKIGNIDAPIQFTVTAQDQDGDRITYSSSNLPLGATLNSITGQFSWTPNQQNIYLVNFIVTDDNPLGALSSTKTVRITVFCSAPGTGSSLTCPNISELASTICPVGQTQTLNDAKISVNRENINIFSPSHPNQQEWYFTNLVNLQWNQAANALSYSLSLDKVPEGDLKTVFYSLNDSQMTYRDLPAGVWYFHLRAQYEDGFSKSFNYKINIDSKAPDLTVSDISAKDGLVMAFAYAKDELSGVKSYEYRLNSNPWAITDLPISLSNFNQVDILQIRAIDNAGNVREVSYSLVDLKQAGDQKEYTLIKPTELTLEPPVINPVVTLKIAQAGEDGNLLIFTGTAVPNVLVNLYLNADQSIIATALSDSSGKWMIVYEYYLKPGAYVARAVALKDSISSKPSAPISFVLDRAVMASVKFPWGAFFLGVILASLFFGIGRFIRKYISNKQDAKK